MASERRTGPLEFQPGITIPVRQACASAIIAVSVAACAAAPYPEVHKPGIPKSEAECLAAGGHWTTLGVPIPNKPKVCDLKATDKDKPCTDSKQCQGFCLAPEKAAVGSAAVGHCSEYLRNYGNIRWVRDGKVEGLDVD